MEKARIEVVRLRKAENTDKEEETAKTTVNR